MTNPLQADPTNDPQSPWYQIAIIACEDDLFDLVKDNIVIAKVPSWVASNYSDPTILEFVGHRIDHCITRPFTGRIDALPRCLNYTGGIYDILENGKIVKRSIPWMK